MPVIPGFRILKVEARGYGKLTELECESIGGGLGEQSEARLYPGAGNVKIKTIVRTGDSFRLRIKGIARSSLFKGAVLVSSEWPVTESREALLLPDGQPLPGETEAVRGGFCPDFNRERFIGRGSFHSGGSFISVRFPTPYPIYPGAVLSILGRENRPRRFTVLWPGTPNADELRKLNGMAKRRPDPHPEADEIYGRILHVRGYVEVPSFLKKKDWGDTAAAGSWLIIDERRKILERKIKKIVSRPGGADDRLLRIDPYPDTLVTELALAMSERGELTIRNNWFFPSGSPPLSPYHRGWLKRIQDAGEEGIRVRSISGDSDRVAVEVLHRSGLIRGGSGVWLSDDASNTLATRLTSGMEKGSRISMADAREILGGSRMRTLEILALMESDGLLETASDGEDRIVL